MSDLVIGNVKLNGNLTLAPMAGFGDVALRRICRDYGAALTTTEMISVKGLLYDSKKTKEMLRLAPNETPSCVQLFGADPEDFGKAVALPELDGFDIIDINMGCPAHKVVKNHEGSAIMKDVLRGSRIVEETVKNAKGRPVTVKIRAGFYDDDINAVEFAHAMQESGAAAVTVHGRTQEQGYSGFADWDVICEVAYRLTIPVIGNGDVKKKNIMDMLRFTEGVAIGRGAIGNPDIFSLGKVKPTKKEMLLKQMEYMVYYFGDEFTAVNIRKHLPYYFAGTSVPKSDRQALNFMKSTEEMKAVINSLDF